MIYMVLSTKFLKWKITQKEMFLLTQPRKKKNKAYKYYSIARSYREGKKVRIEILYRLGKLSDQEAAQMRAILKLQSGKGPYVTSLEEIIFSDHWQYLDCATLNHKWEEWELSSVFSSSTEESIVSTSDIAKILTFNRCLDPGSKAYASRWVKKTALDHILGIDYDKVNDDKIYHELGKIESCKQELEKHLFDKVKKDNPESLDIVFYDLTSSHFEGTKCCLAHPGRTKDHGFKTHKMTLSLIVAQDGVPFSWDVLPGDTPEMSTVAQKLSDCKDRFGIERINLVFDRGMVSESNLKLIEQTGYHYTSALDKDQIPSIPELDLDLFKGDDPDKIIPKIKMAGFKEYDEQLYFKEIDAEKRYIIGFNPTLFKDERRARQERIERLTEFVAQRNEALSCAKKSVNKISLARTVDAKMKGIRHLYGFRLEPSRLQIVKDQTKGITKEVKSFRIVLVPNTENIEKAKLLDGLCTFITNNKEKRGDLYLYPAKRVIGSYRDKDKVERAFRNIKSFIDLNPIYVFKEEHVRAHYTICVLSYLLNITITNQVKEAKTTSLKSSSSIYEELSGGIIGEFKAPSHTEGVKRLKRPTPLQENILSALGCEYLIDSKYIKRLLAA